MLNKIIAFSIKNKLIIGILTIALAIYGCYQFTKLPIDAVPDITNNQVQVITASPSLAAQEVERLITFPIEITMATIPQIDEIRSFFLSEVQKKQLRDQSNIDIDYVSGVAIDEKGFVYTVTSTLRNNNIKKFNVSGKNYFSDSAHGWVGAVDLWVGQYGNILVVEEFGFDNFKVFPNPNNGTFTIQLNGSLERQISIAVYDLRGRSIFNNSFQNGGDFNQEIQLSHVQSGMYILNVSDGLRSTIRKLIIE